MYTQVHVPVTGGWNHNSLTDNNYSTFFYVILSLYLLPSLLTYSRRWEITGSPNLKRYMCSPY